MLTKPIAAEYEPCDRCKHKEDNSVCHNCTSICKLDPISVCGIAISFQLTYINQNFEPLAVNAKG